MARIISQQFGRVLAIFVVGLLAVLVSDRAGASAQSIAQVTGIVIDESNSVLPGARVTVLTASGAIVDSTTTDGAGAFSFRGLPAGSYVVRVDLSQFAPAVETVTVRPAAAPLRITLKPGGIAENVIVTAQRTESRLAETPQKVEVLDATDLDRTVATNLTDALKKNTGVDVVQYPGVLSGIGIRGFRPQTSGLNKRSLLLVDGRQSGITNLATLTLDDVDHVEVVKGAASALYGSSAMGGVVNVITRRSAGKIGGTARIGGASFGGSDAGGRVGGSVTRRIDFDAAGDAFDQRNDSRMGNGVVRPATSYKTYDGSVRVGVDLSRVWRIEGRGSGFRGRDIMTPPDLAFGTIGQGRKNLEQSAQDGRLNGRIGSHDVLLVGYHASEASHVSNVTTSNPLDAAFLPYLSFEGFSRCAANADIWINGGGWKDRAAMLADEPRYAEFKAFREGQVWVYERRQTGTGANDYWSRSVSRPDLVLSDLVKIFHPPAMADYAFEWYIQVPGG